MVKHYQNQKLGFFGGSFDPVHNGHLAIAHAALKKGLDKLFWVPAYHSPLKTHAPQASNADRLSMLELAIAPYPQMEILPWEILTPTKSYTIDTLLRAQSYFQGAELIWLLGEDQFHNLNHWKAIEALSEVATFWVYPRQGTPSTPPPPLNLKFHYLEGDFWDVSSSEIRQNIKDPAFLEKNLPPAVFMYIHYNQC
jgi:nicotinate-nucleotide adenylyltransferase